LHRLGGDPAVAEKHASIIFARLIAVVAPARGFDIGGNDEAGFYAHPRTQTTGLERELRDLGGKTRKAACGKLGLTAWMAAWAVLPQRTMHLLWRPKVMRTAQGHTIDRSRIAGSFSAPGFTRSRLSRKVVLPAIEAEVERLKATPGSRRRQRTSNEEKDVAVKAVQAAYGALTGRRGGRVIGADGRPAGRLHRLGRDIDAIFGTRLFPETDSRRLRRPH
jgi:hypothetical protein